MASRLAVMLKAAGVAPRSVRYLPYDGGGKAMLALLGSEVNVLSSGLGEVLGYVASGDVRVLAIAAEARSPLLPGVPTLTERGHPAVVSNWRGVFGAPGLAPSEQAAWIERVTRAVDSPAWTEALTRYGWQAQLLTGEGFQRYLAAQERQLSEVMRELGFLR